MLMRETERHVRVVLSGRSVNQRLQEEWDDTKCVQKNWNTLKTALCDGAKTEHGYKKK